MAKDTDLIFSLSNIASTGEVPFLACTMHSSWTYQYVLFNFADSKGVDLIVHVSAYFV